MVEVFVHDERGERRRLAAAVAQGLFQHDFDGALDQALRFSFSLTGQEGGARLLGGEWTTRDEAPAAAPRLAVVFPTHNRARYAQRLIRHLMEDEVLRREGVILWVTDQSDREELEPVDPERCRIVRQPNLGCSGGVTRALYEAGKSSPAPTHFLILDDDIFLETDSVLRALRLFQFSRQPLVVGGVMLDLLQPNVLQGIGDRLTATDKGFREVDPRFSGLSVDLPGALDGAQIPFASDFAAWWFCMFPASLMQQIGLPAPFFVRWDDIEYSTRALAAGYAVHVPPGIGVWHQPFRKKTAPWMMRLNVYSLLVYHAVHHPEAFRPFLDYLAEETEALLSRHQYRRAAALLGAMEDAFAGWRHFSTRRFPQHLETLRTELDVYLLNEEETPVPSGEQASSLERRLAALADAEGETARTSLAQKLPLSYAPAAWEHYFAHGSLEGFAA